jgi:hypothetical protein
MNVMSPVDQPDMLLCFRRHWKLAAKAPARFAFPTVILYWQVA